METPYLRTHRADPHRLWVGQGRGCAFIPRREAGPGPLRQNQATIDNIRLWDHRPLSQSFASSSRSAPNYSFSNVSVVAIGSAETIAVMLAARSSPRSARQGRRLGHQHLHTPMLRPERCAWPRRRTTRVGRSHGGGLAAQGLPGLEVFSPRDLLRHTTTSIRSFHRREGLDYPEAIRTSTRATPAGAACRWTAVEEGLFACISSI